MNRFLPVLLILNLLAPSLLADERQTVEVKVGQRIKLEEMGGPNVQLVINGVDQFDVRVTVIDYENMRSLRDRNGYLSQQPGMTNDQFKLADHGPTRIFHRAGCSVFYVPDMSTRMNHARIEVRFDRPRGQDSRQSN